MTLAMIGLALGSQHDIGQTVEYSNRLTDCPVLCARLFKEIIAAAEC